MSEMVDRIAEILWKNVSPGNLGQTWDAQPEQVKARSRQHARMVLTLLLNPTPDVIEAGETERAEGGDMRDQWQVMVLAAGGMPWSRIRAMLHRDEEPAAEQPPMDFLNISPEQKKAWAEEIWTEGRKKIARMEGLVLPVGDGAKKGPADEE